MLKILRLSMYLLGVVFAGTSVVACTQGKIPYVGTSMSDNTENTTQYTLQHEELSQEGDFSYELKEDKVLLKKYTGEQTVVEIPEMINDKEVRGIDARCFENPHNENAINTVRIPSTVSNISTMAFYNSKFLENIECADNMNYLSENGVLYTSDMISMVAYPENKADKQYTMPDSVKKIHNNAFSFCNHLEKVELSHNLEIIPDYAFAYNSAVQNVTAYGKVTHIGFASFCKCDNLKEIRLSETVENINDKAVMFCHKLESISTNAENQTVKEYAESIGVDFIVSNKK